MLKNILVGVVILVVASIAIVAIAYPWGATATVYREYQYEGVLTTDIAEAATLLSDKPHRHRFVLVDANVGTITLAYNFTENNNNYPDLDYEEVLRPGRWWILLIISVFVTIGVAIAAVSWFGHERRMRREKH